MPTHHRPARGIPIPAAVLALGAALLLGQTAHAQPQLGSALPTPRLMIVSPPGGKAGSAVDVTVTGTDLDEPEGLLFSHPGLKAEVVKAPDPPPVDPKKPRQKPRRGMANPGLPTVARFKVTIPPDAPAGIHDLRLVNKWGVSNPRAFVVGDLTEVLEKEPNNDEPQAQRVEINSTVNGNMASPVDVDYYVFAGKKGQRVVLSCLASSIDSRFHPGIELYDGKDNQLAANRNYQGHDALTDCTLPEDGDYYVRVFEFTHTQGTAEHFYRLSITTAPWIDAIHPCVVEPGKTTAVTVYGRNLPGGKPDPAAEVDGRVLEKVTVNVTAPGEPAAAGRLPSSGLVPPKAAALDGFDYRLRNASGWSNPFLLTLARAPVVVDNGANDTAETAQEVTLPCEIAGRVEKRGDRDWYTFSAEKGAVCNIEVLSDRLGAPTYMYFMLRNAATKQYLLEESADSTDFLSRKFYYRSEDPAVYRFTAPADGKYQLLVGSRVADTLAGPRHLYRVRITPDQPDFHLVAMASDRNRPEATTVLQNGHEAFTILAVRHDGFVGDIALSVEGLPPGVTCPPQTLGGALHTASLVVRAAPGAAAWTGEVKVKGTALIRGQKVVREARSGSIVWPVPPQQQNVPPISRLDRGLVLAVRGPAPWNLTASLDQPVVVQGGKAALKLKLERLWPDFKNPLQVNAGQPPQQRQELELPQDVRVTPPTLNLSAGQKEGSLSVTVGPNAQPGTYTLVLRSQSQVPFDRDPAGKQKRPILILQPSAPVTLTVLPKTVGTLALSSPSPTVKIGAQAEVTVTVKRLFGYDGAFKVQVVLPPNAQGLEIPEVVIPAGKDQAQLVVKVPAGARPGNYPNLVVRATAAYQGATTTQEVKLNVNVVK
jgi:hypothetical protein